MRNLRDWINKRAMSQRCINQVQVMPNDFLEHQIEGMYAAVADPNWKCGSWKAYPAWTSDTYPTPRTARAGLLPDRSHRPQVHRGRPEARRAELRHPQGPADSGLRRRAQQADRHRADREADYPEANFVIYHSGIDAGTGGDADRRRSDRRTTEKVPYSAKDPNPLGVNMLIRSLLDSGIIQDPDVTEEADHRRTTSSPRWAARGAT